MNVDILLAKLSKIKVKKRECALMRQIVLITLKKDCVSKQLTRLPSPK